MSETASRKPLRRGIYLLPSLLTTGNLFAGYYSIVATLHGEYRSAAIALGIAFVLDGLDGRIARLTNTQSEFGQMYDSLADVIAFGAAPAVLALSWALWDLGRIGWVTSCFYLICAAIRLARFSIQGAGADRRFFVGLPSPASAGLVAALAFYWPEAIEDAVAQRLLLVIVAGAAALMVSRIRYYSFKTIDLRRRQPAIVVVLVGLAIALIAGDPEHVLLALAAVYAISGPAERVWVRLITRDGARSSRTETDEKTSPGGEA